MRVVTGARYVLSSCSGRHMSTRPMHRQLHLYVGAYDHCGDPAVPHLHLSGLWLEQLGFAIGAKVRITGPEWCLVIVRQRLGSTSDT